MSAIVSEPMFNTTLLLIVLAASITVCFLFLIVVLVLLGVVCLLLNLRSKLMTELMILEKVLGLFAKDTKNLCSLGSAMYSCLQLPPVKL